MSLPEEYYHIGWKVLKTNNDKYGLFYDIDILGEKGALIEISEEVFIEAKEPNCSLSELFEKFDLSKNKVLYRIRPPVKLKPHKNTPTKFYGGGYIVEKIDHKYFLSYQLASHGGGSRRFEINEKIYLYARNSKITITDIFKKFDLYKYDIPENDEK